MAKVKQLTVPCEEQPGRLAHITKVIGDAKVNEIDFVDKKLGISIGKLLFFPDLNLAAHGPKIPLHPVDVHRERIDQAEVLLELTMGTRSKANFSWAASS